MNDRLLSEIEDVTVLMLAGSDCRKFLNNFCSAKVDDLKPLDVAEGFLLDVKGRVLALTTVLFDGKRIFLISLGNPLADIVEHLDRYIITEDVEVSVLDSAKLFWLSSNDQTVDQFCNDGPALPFSNQARLLDEGIADDCFVLTNDWKSGGSVVLLNRFSEEQLNSVVKSLNARKSDTSDFSIQRIMNRFPISGSEILSTTIPQELQRDQASINFRKGCYLGQETVARLDALGHANWKLVLVQNLQVPADFDRTQIGNGGQLTESWIWKLDQKEVGRLCSLGQVPDSDIWIGLVMIRTKYIDQQNEMVFESPSSTDSIRTEMGSEADCEK